MRFIICLAGKNSEVSVQKQSGTPKILKLVCMIRRLIITNLLLLNIVTLWGQFEITGVITDAASGEPIEAAHVFIAHTDIGTLSGLDGHFKLDNLPEKKFDLIISFLGYVPEARTVILNSVSSKELDIKLNPASTLLLTVEVKEKKIKGRKRNLKSFQTAILGTTPNASKCQIINPEVILLSKENNELIATATDLIKIDNMATGYRILFLLESFNKKGAEVNYSGKPVFIPLEPADEKQMIKWENNREKAYNGSKRHFLVSLVKGEARKAGFRVYNTYQATDGTLKERYPANETSLTSETGSPGIYNLKFNQFLKVVYLKEEDRISVSSGEGTDRGAANFGRKGEKDIIEQTGRDAAPQRNPQVSYLFAKKSLIFFDKNGFLKEPNLLVVYNYWTYEGLADMLPVDYRNKKVEQMSTTPIVKKGFTLNGLLIPANEIFDGGPPKDGIPAIDKPKFIPAQEASYLKSTDRVIGVKVNGKARAYPIKILDFHEIVNDNINGMSMTITWCPLCGSGIVFSNGKTPRSFGVSGLLFNSDVLLYDRETESLWSQILGKAVAGKLSGEELNIYPSQLTTWGQWQKNEPLTKVLSTQTGYTRNYEQVAYAQYLNSEKLMFPVANKSDRLSNKERVLGLQVGEKFKAYPYSVLKKKNLPIEDTFNGKKLWIHFDEKNNSARIEAVDGGEVTYFTLFWFAWYGFHPDTEVFE
jgi:hypothetical protein